MFLARVVLFRLHESPRYLVHAGRKEEAAIALAGIAKFNGDDDFEISVSDVEDDEAYEPAVPRYSHTRRYQSTSSRHDVVEGEGLLGPTMSPTRLRPARLRSHSRMSSTMSVMSTMSNSGKVFGSLPRWLRRPLRAWYMRIESLLSGDWKERTLLIWAIWFCMALCTFTFEHVFCSSPP